MPETVLPPNPCLLAIILVTKTRDGASHVFHYPSQPGTSRRRRSNRSRGGSISDRRRAIDSETDSEAEDDLDTSSSDSEDFAAFEDAPRHGSGGGNARSAGGWAAAQLHLDEAIGSSPEKGRGKNSVAANGAGGNDDHDVGHGYEERMEAGGSRQDGRGGDGGGGGFLGLPPGYHHFLCPPSSYNRRRFELTIDQLVFLGRPAYARNDGSWAREKSKKYEGDGNTGPDGRSKRNRHKASSARPESVGRTIGSMGAESVMSAKTMATVAARNSALLESAHLQADKQGAGGRPSSSEADSSAAENGRTDDDEDGEDDVSGYEAGYGHGGNAGTNSKETERDKATISNGSSASETLIMFNVVFVLNPSAVEYHRRVDDMYKYVVKKFTKALRWEQSRSNFVLKEAERLRHLKAKHSSMDSIVKHSPLAKAMAEVYTYISASKIAQVDLTPRTSFSVQLPLPTSISVLPSATEPQLPGIWLTTSQSIASADTLDVDATTSRARLAAHFALLLLDSPASIIAEVTASNSPLAPKLAHYLHHTRPSKSFAQIAQSSGIPLADVQFLASHLIYWRRARAVPPLHHREIYITSPNADMRRLRSATAHFSRAFPTLPSLPKMLSMLSAGPRPYSTFIPSKDHKEAYMNILAWLLRGGWVTQLRSYAWVRVTPEVRRRAREIARTEERAKAELARKEAAAKQRAAASQRRRSSGLLSSQDSESVGGSYSESGTETTGGTGGTADEDSSQAGAMDVSDDGDEGRSIDLSSMAGESITSGDSSNEHGVVGFHGDPGDPDLPSGYLTPMDASMYSTNSAGSAESARTTIPIQPGDSHSNHARARTSHSHLSTVENASYGDVRLRQDSHGGDGDDEHTTDGEDDSDDGNAHRQPAHQTAASQRARSVRSVTTTIPRNNISKPPSIILSSSRDPLERSSGHLSTTTTTTTDFTRAASITAGHNHGPATNNSNNTAARYEEESEDESGTGSKKSVLLILSPARASATETRYLTAIAAQMEEEDGLAAREAWERCLKYFNGEHAMEKVAVREGWRRKKVEALRARWRARGVLLEVRHW